jgi:hypothetical protein
MMFAIEAEMRDSQGLRSSRTAQKTMFGGKRIAKGDTIFEVL